MKRQFSYGLLLAIALAITACSAKPEDGKTTTQRPATPDTAAAPDTAVAPADEFPPEDDQRPLWPPPSKTAPATDPADVAVALPPSSFPGGDSYSQPVEPYAGPIEGPLAPPSTDPPSTAPELVSPEPIAPEPTATEPLAPEIALVPGAPQYPAVTPPAVEQPAPPSGGGYEPVAPDAAGAPSNPLRSYSQSKYGQYGKVVTLEPSGGSMIEPPAPLDPAITTAPPGAPPADSPTGTGPYDATPPTTGPYVVSPETAEGGPTAEEFGAQQPAPYEPANQFAVRNPLRMRTTMEPRSFYGEEPPQLPSMTTPDSSIPESAVPESSFPGSDVPAYQPEGPTGENPASPQLIEPPSAELPPTDLAVSPPPPPPAPLPAGSTPPRPQAMRSMAAPPEPEIDEPSFALAPPEPSQAPLQSEANIAPIQKSAALPAKKTAPKNNDPFDVIKVFYGTDRAPVMPVEVSFVDHLRRYYTAIAAAVVMLLAALAASLTKKTSVGTVAIVAGVIAGVLAITAGVQSYNVTMAARNPELRYSSDRSKHGGLQLGTCEVTIPKTHKRGELESPSILRLEVREDLSKHIVLRKTERLADNQFYEQLSAQVDASPRKEMFVFVHGFNVSFEDAARRTAQIAKDIEFEGAPVFYSWPAHDMFILTYPADENNVAWTSSHLKRFLLDLVHNTDAQSINLIAHSMGSRALTQSLKEIALQMNTEERYFNQVILAAPDIDADDFKYNIAPVMKSAANRVTLYASNKDQALAVSQLVHRYPRAGDAGGELVVVDGIDTIDVSAIDRSPWGHGYYGHSDALLTDLKMLFATGRSPLERESLAATALNGQTYFLLGSTPSTSSATLQLTPVPVSR